VIGTFESTLEFTAATAELARAAARADRLLPARAARVAGVRLAASAAGVRLTAVQEETGVWGDLPASVHGDGAVSVGRRVLATTLAGLDAPEVQVRVEGSRLAIRTPSARFALPLLDDDSQPELPEPPPVVGMVAAEDVKTAASAVAGAASRDGLPLFTGVRVRSAGGRLSLLATDRFRMAAATLPWTAAEQIADVDVLIPATTLADAVRQVSGRQVAVRCGGGRLGLEWTSGAQTAGLVTASLALPFPDAQLERLMATKPECSVEVEADALRRAVDRAVPFGGATGRVRLSVADGVVVVHGGDAVIGESSEDVKAVVLGAHLTASYQGRYLLDALGSFAGRRVVVQLQHDIQPTAFTQTDPDAVELRYLVVPLRHRD
jgi:DNA polymerase-3 subunit beta